MGEFVDRKLVANFYYMIYSACQTAQEFQLKISDGFVKYIFNKSTKVSKMKLSG